MKLFFQCLLAFVLGIGSVKVSEALTPNTEDKFLNLRDDYKLLSENYETVKAQFEECRMRHGF